MRINLHVLKLSFAFCGMLGLLAGLVLAAPPETKAETKAEIPMLSNDDLRDYTPGNEAEVTAKEYQAAGSNSVLLDVRSKDSFARGHIKGSINIPVTELTAQTLTAAIPDKTAAVFLICENTFGPIRSVPLTWQAYPVLAAGGYGKVKMLNLWRDLPPEEQGLFWSLTQSAPEGGVPIEDFIKSADKK